MPELVDLETGRVVEADDQDVSELVASGLYRPASQQEVADELQRIELSDVGSTIAAGAEGVASGATFGAYDAAVQSGALGDEFAEESKLRAEYNPIARGVGEGVGVIGTTLATGGLGATGLATRGAAAATRTLGTGALRGALEKGIAGAITGSVEGAVFGAGHELSQAALDGELEDLPRLAQRVAVAGGWGGLLGAGLGGAGGALADLAGSGFRAGSGKVKSVLGRGAGDDVARAAAGADELGTVGQVATATEDDLLNVANLTQRRQATYTQKASAAERLNDVRQSTIREMTAAGDDIAVASSANRAMFSVSEKPDVLRRIIKEGGGPEVAVREKAMKMAADLEEAVQALGARADDFESGGRSAIKQLERKAESFAARMDEALAGTADDTAEEAVQAFNLLDRFKKDLGDAQVAATRGANGSQAAMTELQALREGLRGQLEDAGTWGQGIAGFQAELNKPWAKLIDVSSAFERRFGTGRRGSGTLTGLKDDVDLTKHLSEADPEKIGALVKGLGRAEKEKLEALYQLKMAREVEYQKTAARLFGADEATLQNVAKIEGAAKRALTALDDARQTTLNAAEWTASQEVWQNIPIAGETIAKGRQTAAKLFKMLDGSDSPAYGAAAQAMDGAAAIKDASTGIVKRLGSAAKKAGKKAGPAARRAVTLLGVKSSGSRDVESYQKIGDRVLEMQNPNSSRRSRGRDALGQIRDERPDVADAYEAQTQRAADFLASKYRSPQGSITDVFGHTRPAAMDPATISQFLRYVEAVQDPSSALSRFAEGELRPEDVEVLREVYPAVYADLVTEVMDQVSSVHSPPPYKERIRLGIMLGVPTDPTLSPQSLQGVQASAARMRGDGQQGGGGKPTVTPGRAKPPEAGGDLFDARAEARIGAE